MKKIFFTLIALLCVSTMSFSQTENRPIQTAVPMLSIAPDARAGGMGDVGAATSPDVNSQYWNPAKYAFMESPAGFSFSFTPWLRKLIDDINLAHLGGYWKFNEFQAVSASLRYFSLGDVTIFDQHAYPQGDIHPNEFALDVAYSQKLSDLFSAAVALRYIRSDLGNGGVTDMFPGNAFAADIAAYYRQPIEMATGTSYFSAGLNLSDLGTKISYEDAGYSHFLPANMRLGVSFDYAIDDYQRISINGDINKLLVPTTEAYTEDELEDISSLSGIFKSFGDAPGGFSEELKEIGWSLGAEYAYNQQFFVRAGYYNENKYKGNRKYFTAGLGFKLSMFELNAGYVIATNQTNPLDQTLRFSLAFDLFGIKNLFQ